MYIAIYAKIQTNGDTHGEVMSNIGVKQQCLLPPPPPPQHCSVCTLMNLTYIWTRSTEILCVCFNTMVAIPLYVDNVVQLLN